MLDENVEVVYDDLQLAKLDKFEKILLFAGNFDMSKVMRHNTHAQYYLDVTNDVECLADLGGSHFRTLFSLLLLLCSRMIIPILIHW